MSVSAATGVVITNPLVKYRALVATRAINADPAQHRLAIYLQELYERLKDYNPQVEYSHRLDQISRTLSRDTRYGTAPARRTSWRSLLGSGEARDTLALTRRLTNLESAMQMQSPKGLMLHGEVGTGKSMLVDLFADCLPTSKKRRWHFNNFMLETFAKLEALRREHSSQSLSYDSNDHSMLRLARDMLETSPILFLDEFQLPDRAASKIMTNLMTSFFHLGGVLVATSNRMPEELAKAAGMEFGPAPQDIGLFGRRHRKTYSDAMFAGQNEFAGFLQVLKARCDVWEMEGANDYRRIESGSVAPNREDNDIADDVQVPSADLGNSSAERAISSDTPKPANPKHYVVSDAIAQSDVNSLLSTALDLPPGQQLEWTPAVLKVYGRLVPVPRSHDRISYWTFDELCRSTLGPADYITLASTYHTIVLTDVPLLTWLLKNEARRFITLLDALYECRCKLLITAAAGPDDLFFPDKLPNDSDSDDAVYSETFAEAYQDATAPFRPNILSQNPNYAEPDAEPDYTHARLVGLLNADALEDDPPNKPRRSGFARSFGRTDGELMERAPIDPDAHPLSRRPLDFSKTSALTGEDERFAYKRAQSRLWEMCGARWWARREEGWHRPVPVEVRRWERPFDGASLDSHNDSWTGSAGDVAIGKAVEDSTRPEESFRTTASPFRTASEPPPKFSWTHVWGTMKWGPKAGAWGQGVDGRKERNKDKDGQNHA